MSDQKARILLGQAASERRRLRRHLLVAAALTEVLSNEPIVVGGTAEEYWTADEYHETDLDLCVPMTRRDAATLAGLGFRKHGRHWFRGDVRVAIEIPDSKIDGDEKRVAVKRVGVGRARIIGVDDLYLDRVRQATMDEPTEDIPFHSALAIAAACFEAMDWSYVRSRLKRIRAAEPDTGAAMARSNVRIRRRVMRALRDLR